MKFFKITGFHFLIIALLCVLVIAPLFQRGLFIDGLLYKTVSHNFFSSQSEFWKMKFNDVSMNPFYEQPPLYFFITGSFFKLFGDSHFTDKILTLLLLTAQFFFLYKILRLLVANELQLFFISLLFLISVPVFCWTYCNQVLETLVAPLSLAGLFVFLKSTFKPNLKLSALHALGFTLVVIFLFLTKGFQSCFIMVVPFLHSFFYRNKQSLFFGILSSALVAGSLFFLLYYNSPSSTWFQNYLQKRLMASLNNVGATTDNHFEIIIRVFTELIFPISVCLLLYIFRRKKLPINNQKMGWLLLITGIFGSFPFAITLEQRGFYLVPSFAFYILALVVFFKEHLIFILGRLLPFFERKYIRIICILLFVCSVGYIVFSAFTFKRDKNLITDLDLIFPFVNKGDTITIDNDSWNDTPLQAYLYMGEGVNVSCEKFHVFYIHDREHPTASNPNYIKVNIPTKQYDLYLHRKNK